MNDNVVYLGEKKAALGDPGLSGTAPTGTLSVVHLPGYREPLYGERPWLQENDATSLNADSNESLSMYIKTMNDANGFLNKVVVDTRFYGDETRLQISTIFEAMSARIESREPLHSIISEEYNRSAGAIREVIIAVNMKLREYYDQDGRCKMAYQ